MLVKLSKSEIDFRVNQIADLIRAYNPNLAQDYIEKPFHRDINIKAFDAGFSGYNAISTEVVCRHIDLQSDLQFGKFVPDLD